MPNLAFIDVKPAEWGNLLFWTPNMDNAIIDPGVRYLSSKWKAEGLNVQITRNFIHAYTGHWTNKDLYKYAWFGHGGGGHLVNSERVESWFGEALSYGDITLEARRYVHHQISELWLIGCETNWMEAAWRENVAPKGILVTMEGTVGLPGIVGSNTFVITRGDGGIDPIKIKLGGESILGENPLYNFIRKTGM